MSYYIPKKHPKDMTKDELFKTQQEIQKQEKARGGLFPLEVNARPANGEPATVNDMHEDATRKQLTSYYEQTAMAGLPEPTKGTRKNIQDPVNEWKDTAVDGIKALNKRDQDIIETYSNAGWQPDVFDQKVDSGELGVFGNKELIKSEYRKKYNKK